MPKIEISKNHIDKLIGKKIDTDKLNELMTLYLKSEIDNVEGDTLTVKFEDTNRPDLWSAEGLARNLRNLLGISSGLKEYRTELSNLTVSVDSKKVGEIRPFIACAVAKNIRLTDELIKSFMQMQDKLDSNYGRKRKKTSIGFYDFDKITFPVLYTTTAPEDVKFVPLGFSEEMTFKEILHKHPKGIEYGHLVKDFKEYPILIDSKSKILSFPPIINSNDLGNVNESTRNLLIEVTGTDYSTVLNTLGIVTIALADNGADIYSVSVIYGRTKERTPVLKPMEVSFKPSFIKKVLGFELNDREIRNILGKMGYEVLSVNKISDKAIIRAPFYRTDIMHDVDVVEDIAIGYGYNEIEPLPLKVPTEGDLEPSTKKANLIREIMIGTGYQEILSFMLCNRNILFEKMDQHQSGVVEIANPISSSWDVIRNSLIPVVTNFLAINKTVEFPQRVFEFGDVLFPDEHYENKTRQETHLCAALTHSRATFTEIKSVLDKLCAELGISAEVKPVVNQSFIEGRCGEIIVNKKQIGIIGELHPQVLENFGLENPVATFEIKADEL
jgi:phenylalanyl-tRNA synthetase beta chain